MNGVPAHVRFEVHTWPSADIHVTALLQGSFIHSIFPVFFTVFFPASLFGTALDGGTDFDSSFSLHRHTLSGPTGPSGLVVTADEEPPSRQVSLTEDAALVQRVTR